MTRLSSMVLRWFLLYAVVELAAVVVLTYVVGLGWTLLLVLATFFVGIALAGSQVKRQVRRLRGGTADPQGALTDGALIGLGTVLVVVPGLVTTALGLLLLLPPTRAAARPAVAFLAAKRVPLIVTRRRNYIDGEVVDVDRRRAACPSSVTRLLIRGRVHSPTRPGATAMAVRDGIVAWLGNDDEGRRHFPDAEIVDLDGAFVAAAFVDSHVHVTATGLTLTGSGPACRHLASALPATPRRVLPHPSRRADLGARLGRVGVAAAARTDHRRRGRGRRRPAGVPRPRRCPLGRRIQRAEEVNAKPEGLQRFSPAASADRRCTPRRARHCP